MTDFHWNMDFKKNKNDDRIAYDTLLNRTQPNNVQHGYLWFKDWLCNRNHENKPSSSLTTSVLTMFSNAWNSLAFLCQLCSDDALICIIIFVLTGDIPGLFTDRYILFGNIKDVEIQCLPLLQLWSLQGVCQVREMSGNSLYPLESHGKVVI